MKQRLYQFVKHPLLSGSMIMLIGSNGANFINYLYHLIMGHVLGPAGYGELAALIALMGLIGIIPGSISLVVIKYVSAAKDNDEISILISWVKDKTFKISLIAFFIILLLAPFISSFLHINKVIYVWFIALSLLFSIPAALNRSLLQGLLKFKEMVISVLLENITKLVLGVLLVIVGFGVAGAMFGWVISVIVGWYLTIRFINYN